MRSRIPVAVLVVSLATVMAGMPAPLGASAVGTSADVATSLFHTAGSPAVDRFANPAGGPVTAQELPGSTNPTEPYAGMSQGCGLPGPVPASSSTIAIESALCYPVNPATGALSLTFDDLSVPERGPALDLTRTYNSVLASTDGPFGRGWSASWSMHLTFTKTAVTVHQENGSEVTFARTKKKTVFRSKPRVIAILTGVPKSAGGGYILTRGARDAACSTFDRACVMYGFSGSGRLLKETDLDGNSTTFAYDTSGRLVSATDAAGRTVTLSYTGNHVSRMLDVAGRTTSYQYDANGNLTAVTHPGDIVTRFTYDGKHRLTALTDSMNDTTGYAYDSKGRVTAITDPLGRPLRFTYGKLSTTIADYRGGQETVGYEKVIGVNKVEAVTLKRGTVSEPGLSNWLSSFDSKTLAPTSIKDPNGAVSKYTYDSLGDILTATYPLGHRTTYRYNPGARSATMIDPTGAATSWTYDPRGNLVSVQAPLQTLIQLHHGDPSHPGDLTSVTDPGGQVWS